MNLVTTSAHPTQNSYISLTDAESYLSTYDRIAFFDSWNDLTDDNKKYALFLAAKALDTLNFKGIPVTKTQPMAFPRLSRFQINTQKIKQEESFYRATLTTNLTSIVSNGDIVVSGNKLVDQSSSANAFDSPQYYENINLNQIIKVSGLSTNTYLTIKDIAADGSSVTIKESIDDESVPTGGVDIWATPLYGYPDEVGYAQTELAFQFVNTEIFQKDVGELPEPMPKSWEMGGTISVTYRNYMFGNSKFSKEQSSPIDIVYMLLREWVSSTGGRLV